MAVALAHAPEFVQDPVGQRFHLHIGVGCRRSIDTCALRQPKFCLGLLHHFEDGQHFTAQEDPAEALGSFAA